MPPLGSEVLDRETREFVAMYDDIAESLGKIVGETKVFDTWMDSSNSNLFVSGYLNNPKNVREIISHSIEAAGQGNRQNLALLYNAEECLVAR